PDAVARRDPAVEAVAAVVDGRRGEGESFAREGAVDDRRDPPPRDRVLSQPEQALAHGRAVRVMRRRPGPRREAPRRSPGRTPPRTRPPPRPRVPSTGPRRAGRARPRATLTR